MKIELENKFEEFIISECNTLAYTLIAKNRDYGDSYSNQQNKFGILSLIIRLSDKISRMESIYKKDSIEVVSESMDDTILDTAGYCILSRATTRYERWKQDEEDKRKD